MTTVTVVARPFEADPVETTSVLSGNRFTAGELPAVDGVAIAVELRDSTGRLVGYGRALETVELSEDEVTIVNIPVRRPFLYAAASAGLFTFDPTRDALDDLYQGRLAPTAPVRVIPLGGAELAVVSATGVDVFSTDDHAATGEHVDLPGMATDAAAIPGSRRLLVGLPSGFTVVDLDASTATPIAAAGASRVTVGVREDGVIVGYGLVNRVNPPEINEPCAGTSQIVSFEIDSGAAPIMTNLPIGLADLAAGIDAPALVGAAPCTGEVVSIEGEALNAVAQLPRAAVVAIDGTRVWAAGTEPSTLVFDGPDVDYVDQDAIGRLISVDTRGGEPLELALPRQRQQMNDSDDPAAEHAQVMKPMSALPADLVVLAGGEFVGLTTRYKYHSSALIMTDPIFGTITVLPTMDATTADVVLVNSATLAISQRVRSTCLLQTGTADIFPNWECAPAELAQAPDRGEFEAVALGALFGAR